MRRAMGIGGGPEQARVLSHTKRSPAVPRTNAGIEREIDLRARVQAEKGPAGLLWPRCMMCGIIMCPCGWSFTLDGEDRSYSWVKYQCPECRETLDSYNQRV